MEVITDQEFLKLFRKLSNEDKVAFIAELRKLAGRSTEQ